MDELEIKVKNKTVVKKLEKPHLLYLNRQKYSKYEKDAKLWIWSEDMRLAMNNKRCILHTVISSLEGCWYRLGKPTCSDPFRLLLMKTCTSRWRCVVYDYTDEN